MPVGTGHFKFSRWEPNQEIVLKTNDHYYEGRPFVDAVVFKIVVGDKFNEVCRIPAGEPGSNDYPRRENGRSPSHPQYRQYQRVRIPGSASPTSDLTHSKPFDDRRVRQAFNYAVDKGGDCPRDHSNGSLPATGAVPPGMLGIPDLRGTPMTPSKAKRLLAEAGYPDGIGFPVVRLWTASKAESTKAELAAINDLAELGLKWRSTSLQIGRPKADAGAGATPHVPPVLDADIPDREKILSPLSTPPAQPITRSTAILWWISC